MGRRHSKRPTLTSCFSGNYGNTLNNFKYSNYYRGSQTVESQNKISFSVSLLKINQIGACLERADVITHYSNLIRADQLVIGWRNNYLFYKTSWKVKTKLSDASLGFFSSLCNGLPL